MARKGTGPNHLSEWTDDYLAMIMTAPVPVALAMSCFPIHPNPVKEVFEAFQAAPKWYIETVFIVLGAAYGLRLVKGVRIPHLPIKALSASS